MKAIAVAFALFAYQGSVAMGGCEQPHALDLTPRDRLNSEATAIRYRAYLTSCTKSGGELIDSQSAAYRGRVSLSEDLQFPSDEDSYDTKSLRHGDSGAVLVVAVVEVTGKTSDVVLLGTSGHERLDNDALYVIRHLKYKRPVTLDGVPVRAFRSFVVRFRAL